MIVVILFNCINCVPVVNTSAKSAPPTDSKVVSIESTGSASNSGNIFVTCLLTNTVGKCYFANNGMYDNGVCISLSLHLKHRTGSDGLMETKYICSDIVKPAITTPEQSVSFDAFAKDCATASCSINVQFLVSSGHNPIWKFYDKEKVEKKLEDLLPSPWKSEAK